MIGVVTLNLRFFRARLRWFALPILTLIGFGAGMVASRRLRVVNRAGLEAEYLRDQGDARAEVRSAIVHLLSEFQDGYTRRDPERIEDFMQRLFAHDEHLLVVGTDPHEWILGYDSVARFIAIDWAKWGDLRLAIDNAMISSSGDAAWIATVGTVRFGRTERPIRFTALLSNMDGRWRFRQVQFQWEDAPLNLSDLRNLSALPRLRFR